MYSFCERSEMTLRAQWLWPRVLMLSALAVAVTVFWDLDYVLRPPLALWFVVVCPGMAIVRLLRISNAGMELTLGIAMSLLATLVVSTVTVYGGDFSADGSLMVLVTICVVGSVLQMVDTRRSEQKIRG